MLILVWDKIISSTPFWWWSPAAWANWRGRSRPPSALADSTRSWSRVWGLSTRKSCCCSWSSRSCRDDHRAYLSPKDVGRRAEMQEDAMERRTHRAEARREWWVIGLVAVI